MFSNIRRALVIAMALFAVLPMSAPQVKAGDVIDVDLSQVDPSVRHLFVNAEKYWEDRLLGYSSEIPQFLRRQISALQITATVESVDGEGGVLGFAGPDATIIGGTQNLPLFQGQVNNDRPWVIAVRSSMVFDIDDFPSLEADGILEDVIIHEMGHALGFGSLWMQNSLLSIVDPETEEMQYTGRYGLIGYSRDVTGINLFVPVQQPSEFVGAGTALAHWNDGGFFNQVQSNRPRKEIMTGFLCDADPNGGSGLFCAPKFLANASLGAMADLGYAVTNLNGEFNTPRIAGNPNPWPKQIDPGTQANLFTQADLAAGVRYNVRPSFVSLVAFKGSKGTKDPGTTAGNKQGPDPYNLRNHNWAK